MGEWVYKPGVEMGREDVLVRSWDYRLPVLGCLGIRWSSGLVDCHNRLHGTVPGMKSDEQAFG